MQMSCGQQDITLEIRTEADLLRDQVVTSSLQVWSWRRGKLESLIFIHMDVLQNDCW